MVPEALESLAPDERHQIYKMLRLQVLAGADGGIEVTGALGATPVVCHSEAAPLCSTKNANPLGLRFRALLTDGAPEVRFERVLG
jgi:hypothetical protein